MRRSAIMWGCIVLLVVASVATAQDAGAILDRAMNAMGGQAKYDAIKTMSMTMNISAMGQEIPMKMTMVKPNKFRVDMDMMGQTMITAFDGTDGWMDAMGSIQDMPPETLEQTKGQMGQMSGEFLMKMKETAEYLGAEDFNGVQVDAIKAMTQGQEAVFYFDKASGLMVGGKMNNPQMGGEMEMRFSGYKDIGGGVLMFHTMEMYTGGQLFTTMNISEVKVNAPVDESIFARPQ